MMHVALAPRTPSIATSLAVARLDDLSAIVEPHLDVVVLRRPRPVATSAYAAYVARETRVAWRAVTSFVPEEGGLEELDDLARALPPDDGRDALIEDIALWAEVMSDLTGFERLGVRLARLDAPMCPRFHIDRVGLRLVVTYAGPGTEWLEERDVDRAFLGARGHSIAPERSVDAGVRRHARPCRAEPFDVVLLKGDGWPGNERRGAVHRSPASGPSEPRLVLTIDLVD
ncbi:MAG: DUF1826 domain-containing protein [Deltaproteobacteria bacterium]|nr:DUF1826 domain-containing protein [Deltaproteobacteria bacterium]